jgi:hypothetical protein
MTLVPTVMVCVLTMWNAYIEPFEGGQYVDCTRCRQSATLQEHGLRPFYYGRLRWKCEMKQL